MKIARSSAALLLIGLLAACSRREQAKPVGPNDLLVSATLSTNTIHIGDAVKLRLRVDYPPDGTLVLPELNRGTEIMVRAQKPGLANGNGLFETEFTLTSLAVSNHVISTNSITFTGTNGRKLEKPFPFFTLQVESLIQGTNIQARDVKGLANWPSSRWVRIAIVIASVVGAGLLIGAVALLLSHRKKQAAVRPPPPPAHEIAIRALEALRGRQYIERLQFVPFYVELSAIVRTYIESRFGLRAPELTTEEFIRETATSQALSIDHQQLTMAFLEQCDLVKFARHEPGADDMNAAFTAAERLVRETITPPPRPPTSS